MATKMIEEIVLKVSVDDKTAVQSINKIDNSTKSLGYSWKSLVGFASGYLTLNLAKKTVETSMAFERLNATMMTVFKTTERVRTENLYLSQITDKLGLSLLTASNGYAKFAVTTKGTNLEGQKTRDIFESVAMASSALSLSADEQGGVFKALGQIMSKGKVQAEELRGQLGDRLSGSFYIAAKAMGYTTAEFDKMLKKGEILSDEFLPKFADQLKKEFSEGALKNANSSVANFNRAMNEWQRTQKMIGDEFTKFAPQILDGFKLINDRIDGSLEAMQGLNIYFSEFMSIFNESRLKDTGITEAQKEKWRADKKIKEEQIKIEKELAKAKKEAQEFEKSLTQSSGFREVADAFLMEEKLEKLRKDMKLTDAEFEAFKGAMATGLKEGMSVDDIKMWTQTLVEDYKDKINKIEEIKPIKSPIRELVNDALELKASLDFSKELGLSKAEIEKLGPIMNDLLMSEDTTEEIKKQIQKLRELGYFDEDKKPFSGSSNINNSPITSQYQVGTKEASAFLQSNKLDEERNKTLKDINRAVQKTAENGGVIVTVKGNGV